MVTPDPIQIVLKVIKVFEKLNISYLVGGSIASSMYGIPRATQDVDIIADILPNHVNKLVLELEHDFYIEKSSIIEALQHNSSFNVIDKGEIYKVDIFIYQNDIAGKCEMENRVLRSIDDEIENKIYVCSAEDIIIHKLYWFKLGGNVSERQWLDAKNVLKVQKNNLKLEYLFSMAEFRDVKELLEKLINENS